MTRAKTIKVPGGGTIDMSEVLHSTLTFDYVLERGKDHKVAFHCCATEQLIINGFEGTALAPVPAAALSAAELQVRIQSREMYSVHLNLITVHDSVLEQRVKRLESLVDAILATDGLNPDSDNEIERRMAERRKVLQRLGWKPYDAVDHRRLYRPLMIGYAEQAEFIVRCEDSPDLKGPIPWRLSVFGVWKRPFA